MPVVRDGLFFPSAGASSFLRGGSNSLIIRKRQGQRSMGLAQHSMVLMTPVLTQTMAIITDPSCRGTIDPDMALGGS